MNDYDPKGSGSVGAGYQAFFLSLNAPIWFILNEESWK